MSESDFDSGKAFYDAEKKAEEHNPVKTGRRGFLGQLAVAAAGTIAAAVSKKTAPMAVSKPTVIPDPPKMDPQLYNFRSATTCAQNVVYCSTTPINLSSGDVIERGTK